ncbi:MAG: ABC transporter permease [Eubacteriales bacterium]|nr:ABC transporter permease [Eubacteriales bacterium]
MNDSFPKKSILSTQLDLSRFRPIDRREKENADVMPEASTFFKDAMKRFRRNPLGMAALVMLVLILVLIISSAFFCPYSYSEILSLDGVRDITAKNLKPLQYSERELEAIANGAKIFPHLFGTDELCRDYFARTMAGTRISLFVGVFASLIVLVIGSIYGSVSGLAGGKTDMIMMRIVDIIYSMPDMLLVILLSVVLGSVLPKNSTGLFGRLGPNMVSLFIVFALLYWVGMARLVRGQILTIRENDYIQAARMIRTPRSRMIKKHILPNCISIILISATMQIPSAIFTESYLSFVGLGVQVPMPSLGALANTARSSMQMYPYKLFFPSLMIALIVLSFNLLGDALRDAFDPQQKK